MEPTLDTRVTEVGDRIYQFTTYVAAADFSFNQYVIDADEPLLFHTGQRQLFPLVSAAIATVVPLERLRWITFGHVEADECGAMNQFLAAAPQAQVAHGAIGCAVSLNDLADRPPRALADGEVIDLGGRCVRHLDTPHVPHAWEARLLYEETTGTLLCGDLFTHNGSHAALTDGDIMGPTKAAEDIFGYSSLHPTSANTVRRLADLDVNTLALMHGPAFTGDCRTALLDLADDYDKRVATAG